MPHGEVTITLQDVEVLLGLPVDGDAISGSTQKTWVNVCRDFLGFQLVTQNNHKQLDGQRILINRLLEEVANPLPPDAEEDQLHKYARCYILPLLGDTIFMDKSGDRVHLMWVQQLENLHNPRRYSWGSACLAWLYRELCRASEDTSQIGGCLLLLQYWAWARFPYLCPTVERGPPVGAYGPSVRGPLSLKWLWVPNKKNRPAHIFRDRYREQLASMLPDQVVWQPYEAHFDDLPPWCVAGRAVWTATVPLVCFHLVEKHTPDRVVRQFGMIQEIPRAVNTDRVLHGIDLRGKIGVNWMQKHAAHILEWGYRFDRRCEAVLGDMPPEHEYHDWFKRVTRRFIDRPGAVVTLLIEGYVRLLRRHPVGTEDHNDITEVLTAVQAMTRVQPPIPEAPIEEAAMPTGLSTSTAPAGCQSRPPVATPQLLLTPDPSASTPHASASPTIPSSTPHPSPTVTIPSPNPHSAPTATIPSPSPHPAPTPTIPSPNPHPAPTPTIPSPAHHPSPCPTIPPPTPLPCSGSDVIGVLVTLNGDLKNQFVETNVGFDTICKSSERVHSDLDDEDRHMSFCASGLHPNGRCTCGTFFSAEEPSIHASIFQILMLADALFEVLDEIHHHPVSDSPSVLSLPAPVDVVDSFPLKNHKKAEATENGAQCYICLAEYEEGETIRVLPCCHEYHMPCIDKWLKEIHGVCPICKGDVCEGIAEAST
ncbi:serine/threonine-protein phosphatase 7 long form homolog [Quercus lobata]|uniref:serine/threonine-protein phosphatase 7 long form homolog n=1 Tax=Quercus lobata TaxID=97700 RepID=UPI001247F23B|nr:serine/threonine-protein phosphatase 7 long form homolog [Quercus lobata]